MTTEFEQLIKLQTKNRQLNLQFAAIREELENIELQMAQVAAPLILKYIKDWRPYIGENAFYINFMDSISFPVKITQVSGFFIKAQGSSRFNTALYSFSIDLAPEEWQSPTAILSQVAFEEFKKALPDITFKS